MANEQQLKVPGVEGIIKNLTQIRRALGELASNGEGLQAAHCSNEATGTMAACQEGFLEEVTSEVQMKPEKERHNQSFLSERMLQL